MKLTSILNAVTNFSLIFNIIVFEKSSLGCFTHQFYVLAYGLDLYIILGLKSFQLKSFSMEKRQEEYRSMKVMPYLGTIPHSGGVGKLIDWGQYMKPSLRVRFFRILG